jgi:hypothetical protein
MSVKVRVAACTRIFRNARTDGSRRRGAGTFGGTGDFPGITLDLFNWVHGQRWPVGFAKLTGEGRTVDAPLGAFRKSAHHGRRRRYPGKRRRNGRRRHSCRWREATAVVVLAPGPDARSIRPCAGPAPRATSSTMRQSSTTTPPPACLQVRTRLSAGGKGIRTLGPSREGVGESAAACWVTTGWKWCAATS